MYHGKSLFQYPLLHPIDRLATYRLFTFSIASQVLHIVSLFQYPPTSYIAMTMKVIGGIRNRFVFSNEK